MDCDKCQIGTRGSDTFLQIYFDLVYVITAPEDSDDPVTKAHKELEELKGILPDITGKVIFEYSKIEMQILSMANFDEFVPN